MVGVTLPIVPNGTNGTPQEDGSGTADPASYTLDDPYGRVVWTKDAKGVLDYSQYDPATGAVIETIRDVNTSGGYTDYSTTYLLATGWSTTSGLQQVTTMLVDDLGRTILETDPGLTPDSAGHSTATVYLDPEHEVRTYSGWNPTNGTMTGPIQVSRDDEANGYTESFTMAVTPDYDTTSNGLDLPDGAETIGSLQSLSRTLTNTGGQDIQTDDYFNLTGLTYSTSPALGTSNNYNATTMADDADGRQDETTSPAGDIELTVFDGLGRTVSTWEGTSDGSSDNNMHEVSADVYDNGGVGDGNLTQETDFVDSSTDRVTDYYSDWRDRVIITVQAAGTADETVTVNALDNMDENVATAVYSGVDSNGPITPTETDGVPVVPSDSELLDYSTTAIDTQSQTFETQNYTVSQSNGTTTIDDPLTSSTWNNMDGEPARSVDPSGTVTKTVYDDLGRTAVVYTTAGSGGINTSNPADVSNDIVLSQTEYLDDGDGNVILTTTRDRLPGDGNATGPLGDGNGVGGPAVRRQLCRFLLRCRRSLDRQRQRRHRPGLPLCPQPQSTELQPLPSQLPHDRTRPLGQRAGNQLLLQ